jgi:NTP pyrophosphatase (non-canonical NTP hydrolase)
MDFKDYQEAAAKTAVYDEKFAVIYPVMGLVGEAGEVAGKVSKVLRDFDGEVQPDQLKEISKEIGDVLWFLAATARDLKLDLNTIAEENIAKLKSRQERGVLKGNGDNR